MVIVVVHRHHIQTGQLISFLLETCITPFHPMRVIPEGGGFLVSSKSVPHSFQSNVCGVLYNTVLFSNTGRYPVAKAVTSIVWESLGLP